MKGKIKCLLALLMLLGLPVVAGAEPAPEAVPPVEAAAMTKAEADEQEASAPARQEARYTVRHCWLGDPDAPICDDIVGTAPVGEWFAYEGREEVPGYAYLRAENGALTIDADEERNRIVLYYSRALNLTSLSAEKVYDGAPLSCNEVCLTGMLAEGDDLRVVLGGRIANVGNAANRFDEVSITRDGRDVTQSGEYAIGIEEGTLTVLPAPIEITAGSDLKRFDGEALICNRWALSGGSLAPGHSIASVEVTGSRSAVGESPNVPSGARIVDGTGADVTRNYRIHYCPGSLRVTQLQPLIVVASSASKVYDGEALADGGYSCDGLLDGDAAEVHVRGEITGVGTAENLVEGVLITRDGREVTGEYEIDLRSGALAVHPIEIEITAGSATKEYDGEALACDRWALTQGRLAPGETIRSVTVSGSRTAVGGAENVPGDAVIEDAAGADVTANYDISYVSGRLRVTRPEEAEATHADAPAPENETETGGQRHEEP